MTGEDRRLLFGTDEPIGSTRSLRAGRLTASLRGARLGPIAFDGHEVWHAVDFLYRDPDWGTPEHVVERVDASEDEQGFHVRIRGRVEAGHGIAFDIAIDGAERAVRYEAMATVQADIATNRTGLVVMHPLDACGRRIEIEHIDERISSSTVPALIAPWPPFMLVRAIRHEYARDAWARCRLTGEDFELEDQRNNADASFKTYSRSNLMPRPYTLRAGCVLRQCVELRIETPPTAAVRSRPHAVQVRVGDVAGSLPAIGTAVSALDVQAPVAVHEALRALSPAVLQLVLEHPDQTLDAHGIARLLAVAGGCALRLDILGVPSSNADVPLSRIARALDDAGIAPAAVAAFPSTPPVLDAARRAFAASEIGGGTPFFFTQLNRIEDLGSADFLSFTTASVVHGTDDAEIMAGLQSLPAMIDTIRARHGALPVCVGPSGIGARRSPLGAQPPSDGSRRRALARRDPRTRALYGAAWAVGYVAQFARAGVRAITLFDLQGDAALVEDDVPTPAFEVLRRLTAPARLRSVQASSAELAVLALERPTGREIVLANLRCEPVEVALQGDEPRSRAHVMDLTSLQQRKADARAPFCRAVPVEFGTLRLGPYAVAFV